MIMFYWEETASTYIISTLVLSRNPGQGKIEGKTNIDVTLWFLFISRRATLPLPSPGSPLRLFQVGIVSLQIGHESAKRLVSNAPNASGCQDDCLSCLMKKLCLKEHITYWQHTIVYYVNYNIVMS